MATPEEDAAAMLARRARPGRAARDRMLYDLITRVDQLVELVDDVVTEVVIQQTTRPLIRIASRSLPLLAVGARTYAVSWQNPLPSNDYAVDAAIQVAGVVVGTAKATDVLTSHTTTGCTVNVDTTVSLAAGAVLTVVAVHRGLP